jgi:hypothetical protein
MYLYKTLKPVRCYTRVRLHFTAHASVLDPRDLVWQSCMARVLYIDFLQCCAAADLNCSSGPLECTQWWSPQSPSYFTHLPTFPPTHSSISLSCPPFLPPCSFRHCHPPPLPTFPPLPSGCSETFSLFLHPRNIQYRPIPSHPIYSANAQLTRVPLSPS